MANNLASAETVTKLLNHKLSSYRKSHEARNYSTMNNRNISAKEMYGILTKLMKNQKVSSIPPLMDNNTTITDPKQKSDLLNHHFSSKANVPNPNDPPPILKNWTYCLT